LSLGNVIFLGKKCIWILNFWEPSFSPFIPLSRGVFFHAPETCLFTLSRTIYFISIYSAWISNTKFICCSRWFLLRSFHVFNQVGREQGNILFHIVIVYLALLWITMLLLLFFHSLSQFFYTSTQWNCVSKNLHYVNCIQKYKINSQVTLISFSQRVKRMKWESNL